MFIYQKQRHTFLGGDSVCDISGACTINSVWFSKIMTALLDKNNPNYIAIRDKALAQLKSGKSLIGAGGVFAPMLKYFLESALEAEMENHLDFFE